MKKSAFLILSLAISMLMIQCKTPKSSVDNSIEKNMENVEETAFRPSSNFLKNMEKKGVNFYSRGNEPSWSLDFFDDGHIEFTSLSDEFKNFNASSSEILKSIRGNTTIYELKSAHGTEIKVERMDCQDNMSGQKFTHAVEITQNGKKLSGCGMYIPDFELENEFSFSEFKEKSGEKKNLKLQNTPTLNFNFDNDNIYGSDGCNRFTGSFVYLGKEIKTAKLASTLMACMDSYDSHLITEFLTGNVFTYHLKDGVLTLKHKNGTSTIWKK